MAQTTEPSAPATKIKSSVGVPVPADSISSLEAIRQAQAPTLGAIFCGDPGNQLWMFELDGPPTVGTETVSSSTDHEDAAWTTLFSREYDWQDALDSGNIGAARFAELANINAHAELLAGTITGPCGSAIMITVSFSYTDQDGDHYFIIPFFEAPIALYEIFDIFPDGFSSSRSTIVEDDPCLFEGFCFDIYSDRLQDALWGYYGELLNGAPPVVLEEVACFVLCKFSAATGPGYLACVAACTAGVAAANMINMNTANNEVAFAQESARISYCACLDWKGRNCADVDNGYGEVDFRGLCGGGSNTGGSNGG